MGKSNAIAKLEGPFKAIARTRAKEWDLQVVDGGSKVSTDGKRVFIPFRLAEVTSIPEQVLHGYLDHEVGHVIEERRHKEAGRVTPMTIMNRLGNPNLRLMMNVFEDIRMERSQGDEYPGVADNLAAAADYTVQKLLKTRSKDFWLNIGGAIICNASGRTLAWMEPAFAPYLGAIQDEMDEACDRARLVWGSDSERLARAVVAKLAKVAEEESKPTPPPPPSPGKDEAESDKRDDEDEDEDDAPSSSDDSDGEDDGEDEDADGDSDGDDAEEDGEDEGDDGDGAGNDEEEEGGESGDSDGDSDESEDSDSDDSEGESGDSDGDSDGESSDDSGDSDSEDSGDSDGATPEDGGSEGAEASEDTGEGEAKPTDAEREDLAKRARETTKTEHLMDELGEEIEGACKAVDADRYQAPIDKSKDLWRKALPHAKTTYQDLAELASAATGALRNKLRAVLQARAECRRISDQVRGELDSSALHTLRLGGKRIFTTETKGENLDVAVSILIDQSGSMGSSDHAGSRSAMARLSAIALGQALDAVGISFEVVGFTNRFTFDAGTYLPSPNRRDYRTPFVFDVFKAFDESFRNTRDRFTSITGCADNADGEAVWECALRLAARPNERRVLIVLSDGEPQCSGIHPERGADYLREVVKRITSAGIEVIGVGIMHEQVKKFYNERTGAKWVNVATLPDLPVVVVKALSESLLARRSRL
jgi:cobaltochelatase CobT